MLLVYEVYPLRCSDNGSKACNWPQCGFSLDQIIPALFEDERGRNNPLFTQRFTFPELPCKKYQKYKHLLLENARKDHVVFHAENKPYEPRPMQNSQKDWSKLVHQSGLVWMDVKRPFLGLSTETPGVLSKQVQNRWDSPHSRAFYHHLHWNLLKLQQCDLNLMPDGRWTHLL